MFEYYDRIPVRGEVYTVCGCGTTGRLNGRGPVGPYIQLAEVREINGVATVGFCLWHFSSLIEAPEEESQCLDALGATGERTMLMTLRQ